MSDEIIARGGRQFRVMWDHVGDAHGYCLSEWDGERWEFVDGAYRTKRDARERAEWIVQIVQQVSR